MEGAPSWHPELADAIAVELPVRGEWFAVHSPGERIPSHGTDQLAQRYAYDLQRLDARRWMHPSAKLRAWTTGVPTHECLGWGEPVHAALAGEVVKVVDGVAERERIRILGELRRALGNGMRFRPTPEWVDRVVGNHVVVRSGRRSLVYLVYAHLAPGSLMVRVGTRVEIGDRLGRVGHSGNSTAPHLHFQAMEGPDPLTATAVPVVFRAYEVHRDGDWVVERAAAPAATERIRSVVAR